MPHPIALSPNGSKIVKSGRLCVGSGNRREVVGRRQFLGDGRERAVSARAHDSAVVAYREESASVVLRIGLQPHHHAAPEILLGGNRRESFSSISAAKQHRVRAGRSHAPAGRRTHGGGGENVVTIRSADQQRGG